MRSTRSKVAAAGLAAIILVACTGERTMEGKSVIVERKEVSAADLGKLAQARIFFGHQSVGYNLLDGIAAVARDKGVAGPAIVEGRDPSAAPSPALLHAAIGRNEDPLGKIRDFEALVRGGVGGWAEVAFMKLCYVDVRRDTDVQALFAAYKEAMAKLAGEYPRVAFLHATLPLTTVASGPKAMVKALLGRSSGDREDNAARERYNRLLRAEYGPSGSLFDLALVESAAPDGSRRAYRKGGAEYYALRPEYTTDGGHLNELGRRIAAEELISSLAALGKAGGDPASSR